MADAFHPVLSLVYLLQLLRNCTLSDKPAGQQRQRPRVLLEAQREQAQVAQDEKEASFLPREVIPDPILNAVD
jgi:hypothetical protein